LNSQLAHDDCRRLPTKIWKLNMLRIYPVELSRVELCRWYAHTRRLSWPSLQFCSLYVTGAENWKLGHDWRLVRTHRRRDSWVASASAVCIGHKKTYEARLQQLGTMCRDGIKKGADFTGKVMCCDAYLKERLVICNGEDRDGRARVTTDEERVLHADWTEILTYISKGLHTCQFLLYTLCYKTTIFDPAGLQAGLGYDCL